MSIRIRKSIIWTIPPSAAAKRKARNARIKLAIGLTLWIALCGVIGLLLHRAL